MSQRSRQWEREKRRQLRLQLGGRCARCGYSHILSILHFHHLDSSQKHLYSRKYEASLREIQEHPERFMLLCPTCHAEVHVGCLLVESRLAFGLNNPL
jgi:hypothetical protein